MSIKLSVVRSIWGSCSNAYSSQAGKGVKQIGYETAGSGEDYGKPQSTGSLGRRQLAPSSAGFCLARTQAQSCQSTF